MSMHKRILLVLVAAFVMVLLGPVQAGSASLAASAVVLTGVLLGFSAHRALSRRDDLTEEIALELNKLRRVYHLGKNLGGERHRLWFTELHGHLYGYLTSFDKKNFSQYQETNGAFRKLSYHLYQIPSLDTEKERVLYRELLEAAGQVAGARQRIQELWHGGMSKGLWNLVLLMTAFSAAAVRLSMGPSDKNVALLVIAALGFGVVYLREADDLQSLGGGDLSKRYVENIARLELSRHE
ncbi:MAG TPA: hypothetical protein VL283_01580 [Candidatus Baltobacteraceae bacterium]|nr:hypothetical protein [Candidatus Baltobacteraceae bacterium]